MIKEFKAFIMRGNVVDLAVGVVIGSAFTAIITKIVEGLITPLISLLCVLLFNQKNADDALSSLVFTVRGVSFEIGTVLSAIITFLLTAFVLFLIVKGANKLRLNKKAAPSGPTTNDYLKQIRDLLTAQTTETPSTNSDKKSPNQKS